MSSEGKCYVHCKLSTLRDNVKIDPFRSVQNTLPDRNGDKVVGAKDERVLLSLSGGEPAVVELHAASVTLLVLLVSEPRFESKRREWTRS